MRDHLVIEGDGTASSLNRKEKKRQKFKVNFPDSVSTENVMKSPDNDIEDEDLKMLEETFQHHYLFCKLKEGQRK